MLIPLPTFKRISSALGETVPEATEPEVTEPEVTEPEVTEPEVTEPEETVPDITTEGDFDAGTPGISDPGEDMVALCAEKGIPVTLIPGPCAAICALVLSGLSTGKFIFEGFLPAKPSEKRARLRELAPETRTVIYHEAPHKLKSTLSDMAEIFGGDRRISLCRELTKLNEEIFRTTLDGAVAKYSETEPRGEYVLVLEGAKSSTSSLFWADMDEVMHVKHYVNLGMSKNDAIKAAAKDRGVPKNEVYKKLI